MLCGSHKSINYEISRFVKLDVFIFAFVVCSENMFEKPAYLCQNKNLVYPSYVDWICFNINGKEIFMQE